MRGENERSSETVHTVGHARARDLRSVLGAECYDRLASFAVVRNPWDRFRSLYAYVRAFPPNKLYEMANAISFNEFVRWSCVNRPQTMVERLTDSDGTVIVRRILRFESLRQDFDDLCLELLGENRSLPTFNVSEKEEHCKFEAQTIEAVQQALSKDFLTFGYSLEPPRD